MIDIKDCDLVYVSPRNLNVFLLFASFIAKSEGRPCEYNSRIYQNGESFQPNCKHQCTCIDGAVGCLPLCPQELSLPNLGCPNPRLVKVPGQCCEEWICDEARDTFDDMEDFFSKEFGLDANEGELTSKNEFVPIVKGGHKMLPGELLFFGFVNCFQVQLSFLVVDLE